MVGSGDSTRSFFPCWFSPRRSLRCGKGALGRDLGSHGNSCGNAAPENGAGAGPSWLPEAHGGGGVTGPAGTPSVPWPRRCPGLGTAGGAAGGPGGGGRRGQQETKPKLPGREGGMQGRDARQGCSGATPAAGIEGWWAHPCVGGGGEISTGGLAQQRGPVLWESPPSQEEKPWQLSSAASPGEVNPRLSRSCAGAARPPGSADLPPAPSPGCRARHGARAAPPEPSASQERPNPFQRRREVAASRCGWHFPHGSPMPTPGAAPALVHPLPPTRACPRSSSGKKKSCRSREKKIAFPGMAPS